MAIKRKTLRKRSSNGSTSITASTVGADQLMATLRALVGTRGRASLNDHQIASVRIGDTMKEGEPTIEMVVQYTGQQHAQPELQSSRGAASIPTPFLIGGVAVPSDVRQRQYTAESRLSTAALARERNKRVDPARSGISAGHGQVAVETIGCTG